MKKSIIVAIFAGALFIAGCEQSKQAQTDDSKVLKKYGEIVITENELKEEMKNLPADYKAYAESEAGKAALLERIALGKMIKAEAKEKGVDKTQEFENEWKDTKDKFLVNYYVEKKINDVDVENPDLEVEYEKQKENYKEPAQVKASHILIKTNEGDSEEVRKEKEAKAQEILKKAKTENVDFAELAKELSEGPSKANGGELGWFTKEKMIPEFAEAAFEGEVGIYPEIVQTQFGYHIINIEEKKEAGYKPFEEVKDELKKTALDAKKSERYKKWIDSLKEKYPETLLEGEEKDIKGQNTIEENTGDINGENTGEAK